MKHYLTFRLLFLNLNYYNSTINYNVVESSTTQVSQKLKKMYGKYESLAVHKIEERLTFDVSALQDDRRPTICYLRNMCNDPWHNQKQKYLQNLLLDSYGFDFHLFWIYENK